MESKTGINAMSRFDIRCTGVIRWFNPVKGFGFIESEPAGREVFLYVSNWSGGKGLALHVGDRVEFDIDEMSNGYRARNVHKLGLTAVAE